MDIEVLDIIIAFVNGAKEEKNYIDDGKNRLWSATYLLNQILRQYRIPPERFFVSAAADKRWKELTDKEMKDYNYTMTFPLKADAELALYKGAKKDPEDPKIYKAGEKIKYRDIFHDEHIIPISMIIQELKKLAVVNRDNVQKILDNLYICRMLKRESREIDKENKTNRYWDVNKTVKEIFRDKRNIELIGWNYDQA